MATKKKSRNKFPKGNKARLKGTGRKNKVGYEFAEVRALKLDRSTLFRYLTQSIHLSNKELVARANDQDIPQIHGIIARMLVRLRESGDIYAFNVLMDRIVGTVAQKIQMDVNNPYLKMSDEELLAEKKRLAAICLERLKQIESGQGMYYVNPPKDVTPAPVKPEVTPHDGKSTESGNAELPSSGPSVASA